MHDSSATTNIRPPHISVAGTVADFRPAVSDRPARGRGWMTKADAKSSERVELSKGTVFLIGLVPVMLALILSYGSSIIGWTREDQDIRTKVEVMSQQIQQLNQKLDKIADLQQQQAVKSASIEGFKTGAASGTRAGDK